MMSPEPMTSHPSLAHVADGIRAAIADCRRAVSIPKMAGIRAAYGIEDEKPLSEVVPTFSETLIVQKCMGLAPFIGDPRITEARYIWFAAMGEGGRHVSTDAELHWAYR